MAFCGFSYAFILNAPMYIMFIEKKIPALPCTYIEIKAKKNIHNDIALSRLAELNF